MSTLEAFLTLEKIKKTRTYDLVKTCSENKPSKTPKKVDISTLDISQKISQKNNFNTYLYFIIRK